MKENENIDDLTLYTRRDVSHLLKIGISSVEKIPESELPRVHLGKSIRFKKSSLIDYINRKEAKSD